MKKLGLEIKSIERLHRLGKKLQLKSRPIINKFIDYGEKITILKNCSKLRRTDLRISEDYFKLVRTAWSCLWESSQQERDNGVQIKMRFDKMIVGNETYSWDHVRGERYKCNSQSKRRQTPQKSQERLRTLKVINLNARSIINKVLELEHIQLTYDPDIVVITETWLNRTIANNKIVPPGYAIVRKDRQALGGGVSIVFKSGISFVEMEDQKQAEALCVR